MDEYIKDRTATWLRVLVCLHPGTARGAEDDLLAQDDLQQIFVDHGITTLLGGFIGAVESSLTSRYLHSVLAEADRFSTERHI
jgi:hypothetical protein